jgi:hypothetical protein
MAIEWPLSPSRRYQTVAMHHALPSHCQFELMPTALRQNDASQQQGFYTRELRKYFESRSACIFGGRVIISRATI